MSIEKNIVIKQSFISKSFSWTTSVIRSKSGQWFLVLISFLEALLPVLPITTDPFLVAAVLANRRRAFFLVVITTVSSVIGGFVAYLMAVWFRDAITALLSPEFQQTLDSFVSGQEQNTFILTIIGAVTPVPYTIIAYAVALTKGSPLVFVAGSLLGRAFRYGIVGWLTYHFGPVAIQYARKYIILTSVVIFIFAAAYLWWQFKM